MDNHVPPGRVLASALGHDPKSLSAFVERSDFIDPEEFLKISKLQALGLPLENAVLSRRALDVGLRKP